MGVKRRAILAIILIVVIFFALWLFGGLDYHKGYCLKVYIQKDQSVSLYGNNTSKAGIGPKLKVCPGQKFQVVYLLNHLQEAPLSANDVMLKPYLAGWDELIKFMETLGPMVGLISQEIEAKTSIIRELALKEEKQQASEMLTEEEHGEPPPHAYVSVRSMITAELQRGVVDFQQSTASGCRTLLRLHRALLWLQLFLQNLAKGEEEAMKRTPAELCRDAYRTTLAQHHSWWVRNAAELAFISMPERKFFYKLMCVKNQAEAAAVLHLVVGAIEEVYNRTQTALGEQDMLALP